MLLFAIVAFTAKSLPKSNSDISPQIIQARLGNVELYIPKDYVRFGHTSIGTESALIQAWYPGATPVPGKGDNFTELWKQGLMPNHVRILLNSHPNIPQWDNNILKPLERLNATQIVGQEYGLLHKTQPEEKVKDLYDVWFEMKGDQVLSYITCTDESDKEWHYPQCSHYMKLGSYREGRRVLAHISYDRRFLPDWEIIKTNVESMFDSFQSQETAREFIVSRRQDIVQFPLKRKYSASNSQQDGDKR